MKGFLRVWKEVDLKDVEKHLLVMGELSCECFSCHDVGISKEAIQCPHCGVHFKYIGFRRKVSVPYLTKIKEDLPHIILIDFEDFKRSVGKRDARKLLDL